MCVGQSPSTVEEALAAVHAGLAYLNQVAAADLPGMVQAGTYSSVMHYLKSMQTAGTPEGTAVAAQMRALPVDDFFAKGRVREDGRLLHDFFLAEVKAPSESTAPWDYYNIRRIIPAEEAAQPLAQSKCALVKL